MKTVVSFDVCTRYSSIDSNGSNCDDETFWLFLNIVFNTYNHVLSFADALGLIGTSEHFAS